MEIVFGQSPRGPFVGYLSEGRYIDVFTSDLIDSEDIQRRHTLSDQNYKPIAIQTTDSVYVIEMQDKNWMYRIWPYPDNRGESDLILSYLTFGIGEEPQSLSFADLACSMAYFLDHRINTLTLYLSPTRVFVRGNQDNFYGLNELDEGHLFLNLGGCPTVQIPIPSNEDPPWGYYALFNQEQTIIVSIDPNGYLNVHHDTDSALLSVPITSYEGLRIPKSLQEEHGQIQFHPRVEAQEQLDQLLGTSLNDYITTEMNKPSIYFIWGSPVPYYRAGPNSEYVNLDTNLEVHISEDLTRMTFTREDRVSLVLVVTSNSALLISEGQIVETIQIGETNLESPRLYPIMGTTSDSFYIQLSERVSRGESLIQTIPVPLKPTQDNLLQQSYEQLLGHLYNLPLTEPKTLDGYTRVNWEEIRRLKDQVVRQEIPILLQPFAGPPGTGNRIVTFLLADGRKLFVKGQIDSEKRLLDSV